MEKSDVNFIEKAKSIAKTITSDFESLKAEAETILQTNPELYEAVKKSGGINMLIDSGFRFNAFSADAVNDEVRIEELNGYIESNKTSINIEALEKLADTFKNRKQEFIESLGKKVSEEEAMIAAENIQQDLVLKPLDTDPIFG